ncbi:hypothetical protein FGG08_001627 [Glutinoglossum americanum]|uniref:Uncharacterized protein n=1 Tax=Glutinoglossum americanum TaxID=1670608 RepID=A0A9P8IEH0_9PEZI|nr:hypothetical protein FGG08_001627 [Glutinoglossum americanum]
MRALSGVFVMNKTLSDDIDGILALQGIGWFMRKAISLATVTLSIKEYEEQRDDSTSVTHIDIEQTATGGIGGTTELRILDWTERHHSDNLFGELLGKSRWRKLEEIGGDDAEFLATGWLDEVKETGLVESYVVSDDNGWTARQIWGFEEFEEARYYTRHVVVKKDDTVKKAKLVYNFIKSQDKD